MDSNSPLFDKIRVRRGDAKPAAKNEQICNHPGCEQPGQFRAPMGREREGRYFLFCKEHVREYNASYNYFSGMSDEDVSKYQKDASIGHRPTWDIGTAKQEKTPDDQTTHAPGDILGLFKSRLNRKRSTPVPNSRPLRYGVAATRALAVLSLDETTAAEEIKIRYKALVKKLHPDANGGDRANEDKLREIITAYNYLKSIKIV